MVRRKPPGRRRAHRTGRRAGLAKARTRRRNHHNVFGILGERIVPEKAILLPCLHDEAYAYLPRVCEMMLGVAQLAFNSESTFAIARHLYGPAIIPRSTVVGSAISWPLVSEGSREPINFFQPE